VLSRDSVNPVQRFETFLTIAPESFQGTFTLNLFSASKTTGYCLSDTDEGSLECKFVAVLPFCKSPIFNWSTIWFLTKEIVAILSGLLSPFDGLGALGIPVNSGELRFALLSFKYEIIEKSTFDNNQQLLLS